MQEQYHYHILTKGFRLQQKKGDKYEETELRHYRLLTSEFKYETKDGKDVFTNIKTGRLFGSFPASSTLILVEAVKDRDE